MSVNDESSQSPNETQHFHVPSLRVMNADSHDNHQETMPADDQGIIRYGDKGYATVRARGPADTIGLEAALRLL